MLVTAAVPMGKLFSAELNQKIFELCIELEGAEGMLHANGYPMIRSESSQFGVYRGQFLRLLERTPLRVAPVKSCGIYSEKEF